jgi:hypothetical protein
MKSVYVYAIICVVLILIGVGGYHFFTKGKVESGEPETIVIGGGEKQTSGTEGYIAMANRNVPIDVSPYNLYAYNPKSLTGTFGGSDIFNQSTGKCPDGTLDCLYYEKVENDRVVDILDKDGNKFVQQFVDDFYDGKLPLLDDALTKHDITEMYKLTEDNKIMKKIRRSGYITEAQQEGTWETAKPGIDIPVGQYLIILMILYKLTGKPKPNVVIDLPVMKREDNVGRKIEDQKNSISGPSYGPEDPRHPDHPSNKNVQPIPDSERKEKRSYEK